MGSGDVGLCRLVMENTYDDFCLEEEIDKTLSNLKYQLNQPNIYQREKHPVTTFIVVFCLFCRLWQTTGPSTWIWCKPVFLPAAFE
jgi:hypothetical protein